MMIDKTKKAKAKPKVRRSLGNQPLKKSKDLNHLIFNDLFSAFNNKKKYLQPTPEGVELQLENYGIVLDQMKKQPFINNILNLTDTFEKDSLNKIRQEDLFSYLKEMIFLDNNILIYGIGSKLKLMYDFINFFQCTNTIDYVNKRNTFKNDAFTFHTNRVYNIIIINGFNPDIKLANIIERFKQFILDISDESVFKDYKNRLDKPKSYEDDILLLKDLINNSNNSLASKRILLIFNNIDGSSLLGKSVQKLLSLLISSINMQVISTCDNVYYYYYWSQLVKDNFRFYFVKYNTFEEYNNEICDKFSITGEKNIKSGEGFIQIFKGLTKVQRKIIKAIAEYQINSEAINTLTLSALRDLLIENMIVSNSSQIKDLLLEPMDHDLIVERNGKQGKSYYKLNLEVEMLSNIVNGNYDEE